ncbi:hypothetical protein [Chitinophaga rhizophila]|uniref:Phage protein n=1 Tax=Chitinophaga rhizophila TaxID=2866212 RepID=A0ABS7GDP4_9BACT|nr:hypothetical protein [Chitinophaga rhizophila]MBW8685792.1 hypothetical protein [Chitinophaga rhizophila]
MNTSKKIYSQKVKPGAYEYMIKVLKYPEQVDPRMDGKVCRITVTDYKLEPSIQAKDIPAHINDRLFQVEVHGIDDREYLILASQLEYAGQDLVVVESNTKG